MGTPEFAEKSLSVLLQTEHEIACVYTQSPKPAGRGMKLRKSPVHNLADHFGIPVLCPEELHSEKRLEELKSFNIDVLIIIAYGLIIPKSFFSIPRYGGFNLHASLLPRWRGAAPIQRAIMEGDKKTGVQIMKIAKELDSGDLFLSENVDIHPSETGGSLHDKLAEIGAEMWPRFLEALERGHLTGKPQDQQGIRYAHKIKDSSCKIDWSQSALSIDRKIRALSPYPASWFYIQEGKTKVRIKCFMCEIIEPSSYLAPAGTLLDDQLLIACGTGAIRLLKVQKQGKKILDAESFLRGFPIHKNKHLCV